MALATSIINDVFHVIDDVLQNPEAFLIPGSNKQLPVSILKATKNLYDYTKLSESTSIRKALRKYKGPQAPLKTLLVDGFDSEAVWEELQLQNEPMIQYFDKRAASIFNKQDRIDLLTTFMPKQKKIKIREAQSEDDEEEAEEMHDDMDMSDMDNMSGMDDLDDLSGMDDGGMEEDDEMDSEDFEEKNRVADAKRKANADDNSIDDRFFDMEEMNQFADEGEDFEGQFHLAGLNDDEHQQAFDLLYGDGGLDEEDEEDEEGDETDIHNLKYDDFFAPPTKKVKWEDADDDDMFDEMAQNAKERELLSQYETDLMAQAIEKEEEEDEMQVDDHNMSTFERQQLRLQQRMTELEEGNLKKKTWKLSGEALSQARPENSLLKEKLEFEQASKVAPTITQDFTDTLEDIIIQRIKDGAFDDVVRKVESDKKKGDWRASLPAVSDEKSTKSLAQLYEEEYLKQTQNKVVETVDPKTKEVRSKALKIFSSLIVQLDALSNMNFTPLRKKELEITAHEPVAALQVEEIIPAMESEAIQLAPEEIYRKQKKVLKGESETTQEERRQGRRDKKEKYKQGQDEKKARRQLMLQANPSLRDKLPTVGEAMKELKHAKNVTVAKNTDTVSYGSSAAVFKKIQDASKSDGQPKQPHSKKKTSASHSVKL